jgi:hypothetical protein
MRCDPGVAGMTHGGAGRHKIDSKVRAKLKTNAWYRAALPVPSITRAMPSRGRIYRPAALQNSCV